VVWVRQLACNSGGVGPGGVSALSEKWGGEFQEGGSAVAMTKLPTGFFENAEKDGGKLRGVKRIQNKPFAYHGEGIRREEKKVCGYQREKKRNDRRSNATYRRERGGGEEMELWITKFFTRPGIDTEGQKGEGVPVVTKKC